MVTLQIQAPIHQVAQTAAIPHHHLHLIEADTVQAVQAAKREIVKEVLQADPVIILELEGINIQAMNQMNQVNRAAAIT